MNHKLRKYGRISLAIAVILIIIAAAISWHVSSTTSNILYDSADRIPSNRVGVILGTSKYIKSGHLNGYFSNRIDAAVELYRCKKIVRIVASGDHGRFDYNEPEDMKQELVRRGVPASHIYLDYAGFRTFDSIYRMKAVFGLTQFTIISQKFHNQRAAYIAQHLSLNVIGYNAKDPEQFGAFLAKVREYFARIKLQMDLLFDRKPKFLGRTIIIL